MIVEVHGPRGHVLRAAVARTRRERTRGLRRRLLADGEAMWFDRASSVHTFGMREPILVARLNADGRVVDARVVPPRRLVPALRGARSVLECRPEADVHVGDALRFVAQAGQPPSPAAPVTTHEPS